MSKYNPKHTSVVRTGAAVKVGEMPRWERLPRAAVEPPSLEVFTNHVDEAFSDMV